MIELTGKSFIHFYGSLLGIEYDVSEGCFDGSDKLYLEFCDGELQLYIYNEKLNDIRFWYFVEDNIEYDEEYIGPFKKEVEAELLIDMLSTIHEEGGEDEDILKKLFLIRIFMEKDKVYLQLINRRKPSLYGYNIEYELRLK